MDNLDYNDIKHMRASAIAYAMKRKCNRETAEDFAQEYVTAIWLGETQNLLWHFSNFFRKYRGRSGKKIVFNDESYEDSYTSNLTLRLEILEMKNAIELINDKRLRITLKLLMHDVPQVDIAEIFEVTEARVSQMTKKALQELRKKVTKE